MGFFGNRRNSGGLLSALFGRPQANYTNRRNYRNPLVGALVSGLVGYGISRFVRGRMNGGQSSSIWGGSDNIQGAGGGSTWNPGSGGGSSWNVGNEPGEKF